MKVISMVPSWTETLLESGIDVVGRTRYCIHPKEKVSGIQVVGGTKDINWSKVKLCGADILLLDQEENPKFMAEQSPIPVISTHVRSLEDVLQGMQTLRAAFQNSQMTKLSERWKNIIGKPGPMRPVVEIPGIIQWIKPPTAAPKSLVYIIWKDPWMAVSKETFIGSVLKKYGFGDMMVDFDKPYPEISLENLDCEKTLLLFSSEPYPFHKKPELIRELPFASAIVDGESYSWFGIRTLRFLEANL